MYLEVTPNDTRTWFLKYRLAGRERRISFGSAYEVSLAEARRKRDEARALVRDGQDPVAARRATRNALKHTDASQFYNVAREYLGFRKPGWAAETYRKYEYIFDTYLIPVLRRHSITTLTTQDAVRALEVVGRAAPSLAVKARQLLHGIVAYAIQKGLRPDGHLLMLRGALPSHEKGNIPALVDPQDVVELLKALDAYATPVVRAALKFNLLTAQRPGNICAAEWSEMDLDAAEWNIPADKMKTRVAHIVPLSQQAVAILREMQGYTGGHQYVFPPLARQQTPHLHRDALSAALRRMGFQNRHSTHGFRSTFRTLGRERLNADTDVLEAHLAHAKRGEVQQAYDRTQFIEERHRLAQEWADYLDQLRSGSGGKVIPMPRRRRAAA